MRSVRLLGVAVMMGTLLPLVAWSQSGPEEQALLEMFFAKDVKAVEAHLPEQLREKLSKLSPVDRAGFESAALLRDHMFEGAKLSVPEDGHALLSVELTIGDEHVTREIRVRRKISNGRESLLDLEEGDTRSALQVWMVLEHDVWCLVEVSMGGRQRIVFDDGWVERFRNSERKQIESETVQSIRTIQSAVMSYASRHKDLGVPIHLDEINAEPQPADPDEAAAFREDVDSDLVKGNKSGYRFEYQRMGHDEYVITARPASYAGNTRRSFWLDARGQIRFTDEDRAATEQDTPLP